MPRLFIDGEPSAGLMYMPANRRADETVPQFAAAGVHIYNAGPSPVYREDGSGEFDYDAMSAVAADLLNADPKGWFLPRTSIPTPPGWLDEHPDDVLAYYDGPVARAKYQAQRKQASLSSEAWRGMAATELTRYIHWLEATPFGARTIGYHVTWGVSEEWVHPSAWSLDPSDYSPAEAQAFRRFLRQRYEDDESLRAAWGDAQVSLETAAIPRPMRRVGDAMSVFRNLERDMDLIDFYAFRAASVADGLMFFADIVKRATDRKKLVAAFYGYLMGMAWHRDGLMEAGHLGLPEVLRCPDIDILISPATYVMRGYRTGTSLRPTATRSVALAGKLWLDENDLRTHSGHQHGWGWTDTVDQTIEVQRRNLACTFAGAQGTWWMDQNGGWYADEPTMAEIAHLAAIGHRLLDHDPSAVAEIAFVIDPASLFVAEVNADLAWCVLEGMDVELSRIGAPVDRILLDDLERAGEYSFYIVANTFCTDDRKRDLLDRFLKRNGKTVLWLYAPGYFRDHVPGEANVSALTGITVRETQGHYTLQGRTGLDVPEGFPRDHLYGSDRRVKPTFWITDPDAEILAVSEDNAHAALAVKDLDDWNSAYSACAPVSATILRYLACRAGAHIWWDGEGCFFANRSMFAVQSRTGGEQCVRLPRPHTVIDLLDDHTLCEDADIVRFGMPAGTTRLFLLK